MAPAQYIIRTGEKASQAPAAAGKPANDSRATWANKPRWSALQLQQPIVLAHIAYIHRPACRSSAGVPRGWPRFAAALPGRWSLGGQSWLSVGVKAGKW